MRQYGIKRRSLKIRVSNLRNRKLVSSLGCAIGTAFVSPVQKPIPNSLIKRQLVLNAVKTFLVNEGKLARTPDHEVNLAFEIAPFGKELQNSTAFWTGPISAVKVTESDVINGGSESISFTWNVDPMAVSFPQNTFVSAWGDGIDSLTQGYIQMSPPMDDMTGYLGDSTKRWCYRFVLSANSYEAFSIVLETVPASLAALKDCPWGNSLVTGGREVDRWSAGTSQTLTGEFGEGLLPFLHDTRLPKYEKESLLPTSSIIRNKVWETLSSMGTSCGLEDDEMVGYDPSLKRRTPSFPEISKVEEAGSESKKRKLADDTISQPLKSGDTSRIKALLSGMLGGTATEDELRILGLTDGADGANGANNGGGANVNDSVGGTSSQVSFETPAAIGMDVTGFMSKMPPGISRECVRQMTFKNIEKAMRLSENMGVEDRTEALYRSVTELKVIPEAEHNRKDILHPAMFFPGSMAAPEVYWSKYVPLRVDPHVTGIPLTHVGLENEVAPLAIEKAGDKTKRLYIKYFLQNNVNIQQKAPKFKTHRGQDGAMGMSMDENWQEAQKVSEIQDAVFSYVFVMADLHPRDFGPRNLLRLMHKLDWLSFRKDQLFALKLVIDGVLGRYHYLANQKKPPLYWRELQDFVTTTLEAKGGPTKPADVAMVRLAREHYGDNFAANDGSARGRGRGGRGGRGGPSAAAGYHSSAPQAAPGLPLCYQFNSVSGCPRDPSGRKCFLPSGKCLFHLCSQTNGGGEECLAPHAMHNHK